MIKKNKMILFFIVGMLLMTTSCNPGSTNLRGDSPESLPVSAESESKEADSSSLPQKTSLNPTGYDDGGIQQPFVYYENQLYIHEGNLDEFSSEELAGKIESLGLTKLGPTVAEQNFQWPSENLEATRIEKGSDVYFNPASTTIYVVIDGRSLSEFKPYTGEQYELNPAP